MDPTIKPKINTNSLLNQNSIHQDSNQPVIQLSSLAPELKQKPIGQMFLEEESGGGELRKPRGSVIYQQMENMKNKQTIEDGRETKFYFERYRATELCRFMLMLIAQGMNILSYDLEFEDRDEFTNTLISYVIFLTSIILAIMTVITFQCQIDFQVAAKILAKESNLYNTGMYKSLAINILLYLVFPYPWTSAIKIKYDYQYEDGGIRQVYYNLNEILTLIMLMRTGIMIKSVLIFSRFVGSRPSRVCNFYACKSDNIFIIKCMMKKYPLTVFTYLYLGCIFFFAFAIRICERPLVRITDEFWQIQLQENDSDFQFDQNFNSFLESMWCVVISLPTVGYGDRFPRTHLGRFIITICAIVAAFLFSLLVEALANTLQLSKQQQKSFTVLEKISAKFQLKDAASNIIVIIGRIKLKQRKQQDVSDSQFRLLKNYVDKYKSAVQSYKNIQNETSDYDQLDKEFEYLRSELTQFKQYNEILKNSEQAIQQYILSYGGKKTTILKQKPQNQKKFGMKNSGNSSGNSSRNNKKGIYSSDDEVEQLESMNSGSLSHHVGFIDGFESALNKAPQYNFEAHDNQKDYY